MYDQIMLDDLKSYRHNLDNINEISDRYNYMKKVIKCRTLDKLYLLKWLYYEKVIDILQYNEYMYIVINDCRMALLYICGILKITDIEQK